jgi:ribose transport system ATP-binding protein
MGTGDVLLELRGISKTFGAVQALDGVDFAVEAGRVHALVGENGAGKSTLIKIMTGAYRRDAGRMTLDGEPIDFRTPQEAQAHGVVAVYQEVNLLAYSTVAETLSLGREPTRFGLRFGFIDHRRMNAEAAALLRAIGLQVDPTVQVGTLPIALRQMVAIARGVSLGAKVLILDEPTSSLTPAEVALLFDLIRKLTAQGTGVVYVSHRLDELYTIGDSVTVLRDGRLVETRPLAGLDRLDLVCAMLGKRRDEVERGATAFRAAAAAAGRRASDRAQTQPAPPLLEVRGARSSGVLTDVSLTVTRGEIVGLAGLLGSGRSETAHLLFGIAPLEGGEIRVDGAAAIIPSPRAAIARGFALLSEDRKRDGIVPDLSVRENLTLAALPLLSRFGIVSAARQRRVVERLMDQLRIKAASPDQPLGQLSGGNQQKVLLARWLCRDPRLLLLDEPTRGIDIGAKSEIQFLIAELAAQGLAVLMISSDLEELIEGSDRVVVLRDGRTVATLRRGQISEAAILSAIAARPSPSSSPPPTPAGTGP